MKKRKKQPHIQHKLQDQALWMSIAAVFLLFFIGLISFSDRTILTGSAVQNIAFVQPGSQITNEVQGISGFQHYTFEVLSTIKNGKMIVDQDNTIAFDRSFYSKFRISSDQPEKIGTIILSLKIPQQELQEKHISQGDLRLFYNGQEAETTFLKKDGRYLYYSASAAGVGEFVIGKATSPEITHSAQGVPEEIPTEEIPPETITIAIPQEENLPLAGQAIAEPQVKPGFWVRIKTFLNELFG